MEHAMQLIDTGSATLERVSATLIELRFKPDMKLTSSVIDEVIKAKQRMCLDAVDILAIMPPEVDLELNVMSMDHDALDHTCGHSRRLAFAAQSPFNERMATIFFRYHPRPHPTAVFLEVADARAWLTTAAPQPSLS
jgi:hypothetical protein